MTGIEYVVSSATEPSLYVINKIERKSPSESVLLESFYILDGTIYQCPTVQSLLSNRLVIIVQYINLFYSRVIVFISWIKQLIS